jgi:Mg2+ and Co2+ transporter CorA
VDTFFPALDLIGGRVEDLKEAIFEERRNRSSSSIYELRKELIAIRRVALLPPQALALRPDRAASARRLGPAPWL